jgi:hypothetical protein
MKLFNKLVLTATLAVSGMSSAYAANDFFDPSFIPMNIGAPGDFTNTWSFGTLSTSTGAVFDEYFSFNVPDSENISFSMVSVLTGGAYGVSFTGGGFALYTYSDGVFSVTHANNPIALSGSNVLTSGTYILEVAGSFTTAGGSYAGAIVGTPHVAAVPEPTSWLMMLAGLTAVAGVARRRKNQA